MDLYITIRLLRLGASQPSSLFHLQSFISFSTMSLIFIICTLLVHVLALPSIPHHPPSGLDITHQIAKRADSPKSARLKASLIPNTHFFVTTLNVNGKNVSMLIDTGSADLCPLPSALSLGSFPLTANPAGCLDPKHLPQRENRVLS